MTASPTNRRRKTPVSHRRRRGTTLVLSALLMIVFMAFLAFSIDVGYMCLARAQLGRAVDAAALAGASALVDGQDAAEAQAVEYLVRNPVGTNAIIAEADLPELKNEFLLRYGDHMQVSAGTWDPTTRTLNTAASTPSALKVSIAYPDLPFFFARALGYDTFTVQQEAVAMFQPRDIMLVLDFSGSMNDDSQLSAISKLGEESVLANIHQMWQELGSPTYGNMGYEPDWVTIPGNIVPANVTWRGTDVVVSANSNIQKIRVYKSNGYYRTFNSPGTGGTFSYSGNLIYKCRIWMNGTSETIDFFNDSHIRRGLGLDGVPYPSQGSWNDYINYARNHSSRMPWYSRTVYDTGFRRKFGVLTLINFWNRNKPMNSQTPDLWKVSAQPVTAVKNATDLFMDHIAAVDTDDRVGLAIYDAADGNAIVESPLTHDLPSIANIVRHRQAGHYHRYTNIGAGMQSAREELMATARPGAFKMIVLMTDGRANWYHGGYNPSAAVNEVLHQAELCRAADIPVMTISLGAGADAALMQSVADTTEGIHFNVPGGSTVAEYSAQLLEVFRQIARARPLRLVL